MARFRNHLDALLIDERRNIWKLSSELVYDSDMVGTITVPVGFRTNFASVPRVPVAYTLAGDTARAAATIHDYLYSRRRYPRLICDSIFLEAMKATKIPWWRRHMMYLGVRLFGWRFY